MTRKAEGSAVVAGVVLGIAAVLAIAVAWGPKHECVAQFPPELIGCAIGTYESLTAGLIAAGGAVFAGWLAWSAARDQIALARRQTAEATLLGLKANQANAEFELSRLTMAKTTMFRLDRRLRGTKFIDNSPRAPRLVEMLRRQEFLASGQDLTTNSMGGELWESANRIRLVAQQIQYKLSATSADQHPSILQSSEDDAVAATDNFNIVTARIDSFIAKQQAVVDGLKSQVSAAESKIV